MKVPDEETDEICEVCGKPMVIKIGRFGKFMSLFRISGVHIYKEDRTGNRWILSVLRKESFA